MAGSLDRFTSLRACEHQGQLWTEYCPSTLHVAWALQWTWVVPCSSNFLQHTIHFGILKWLVHIRDLPGEPWGTRLENMTGPGTILWNESARGTEMVSDGNEWGFPVVAVALLSTLGKGRTRPWEPLNHNKYDEAPQDTFVPAGQARWEASSMGRVTEKPGDE